MKKLVIGIVLANLLVACASEKPKEAEKPAPAPAAAPASAPVTASAPAPVVEQKAVPAPVVGADPLNDPNGILAKRSVYYPFDVSAVQDADKPVVQAHAQYLGEHADRKVRVEGNADERGSNEYNLALGQRRAEGVKKMLVLGGTKAGQVDTVSYGEEKPVASGHDESSWSQNRRSDIKY
ncbi:MAG: peptidoglycan-associated lipoprotein Pal [Nitrosomonadales bacterium]|nr:peptidoglycan-associated lipoprotein Pal [Nitrosomonadales bacterium]